MPSQKLGLQVLLIEANQEITVTIKKFFKNSFINITACRKDCFEKNGMFLNEYNLVICDTNIGRHCYLQLIKKIRSVNGHIPVVVLSKQDKKEEINAYQMGVNIFHTKPLDMNLLESQIGQLLKYFNKNIEIKIKDFVIQTQCPICRIKDKEISLTPSEHKVLQMLFVLQGGVLTRDRILSEIIIKNKEVGSNSVDTMICRIRKKFAQHTSEEIIQTICKSGYRISTQYTKEYSLDISSDYLGKL